MDAVITQKEPPSYSPLRDLEVHVALFAAVAVTIVRAHGALPLPPPSSRADADAAKKTPPRSGGAVAVVARWDGGRPRLHRTAACHGLVGCGEIDAAWKSHNQFEVLVPLVLRNGTMVTSSYSQW